MSAIDRCVGAFLLCAAAGCAAPDLEMTYRSDPPGASLYVGGRPMGYTPHTVVFTPDDQFRNGGCMYLPPLRFQWVSGAQAQLSQLPACAARGYHQSFIAHRPADVPGLEADARFGLDVARTRAAQSSADSQARAADAAILNALKPTAVSCTSTALGNQTYTRCR